MTETDTIPMRDAVELDRRGFFVTGLTALSAAAAGTVAAQTTTTRFQEAAVLIGPIDARPAPGGEWFDNKLTYTYIYRPTDDTRSYIITEEDSTWTVLNGPAFPLYDEITSNTTVRTLADIYPCDTSGGGFTVTLGTELENDAVRFTVKKTNGGSVNAINMEAESGKNIDGSATDTIIAGYGAQRYYFSVNDDQWYTI
jgi:hypothetical protein